jgi:hypothetical protein
MLKPLISFYKKPLKLLAEMLQHVGTYLFQAATCFIINNWKPIHWVEVVHVMNWNLFSERELIIFKDSASSSNLLMSTLAVSLHSADGSLRRSSGQRRALEFSLDSWSPTASSLMAQIVLLRSRS